MEERQTIQEINTRFTSITNELHYLEEVIPLFKKVRKIFVVLPKQWKRKVDVITEVKNLKTLNVDEFTGIVKTHELKKQQELEKKDSKREKSLALKASKFESSEEETNVDYMASRIVKAMKMSGQFRRRSKGNNVEVCHKCEIPEHFIKDCPMHKMVHQDCLKYAGDKGMIRLSSEGLGSTNEYADGNAKLQARMAKLNAEVKILPNI
ncbi:uncharacterized protein LOC124892810 [Capsicum annuum]|uniref:uncharacterized protein LOC124892810 n=1 Tax=Capsicum annuum TaxID=4072 RepID=UPI001FB19AC6|nr:uncharacterized protein LOC124892810 [Capsicum annuum]